MAYVADHWDSGESAALAALLDPVALEARLADARARRALALSAKPTPPPAPTPFARAWTRLPGGKAALLLGGLAVAAGGVLLTPRPRSAPAPAVALTTAVLVQPAAIPSPPAAGATASPATTLAPPQLAALVLAYPLLAAAPPPSPELRPEPWPPRHRVVAASKTRAAGVPFVEAAPVLAWAVSDAIPGMIGRSVDGGPLNYPLAVLREHDDPPRASAPMRAVRQVEDPVRQTKRTGVSAKKGLSDRADRLAESVRRAVAALGGTATPGKARSADANRQGSPGKRGSPDHSGKGGAKGMGDGKSTSKDAAERAARRTSGKGRLEGRRRKGRLEGRRRKGRLEGRRRKGRLEGRRRKGRLEGRRRKGRLEGRRRKGRLEGRRRKGRLEGPGRRQERQALRPTG